ncbi:MAG: efflux RND transporter periplasmic adaptor subunit [Thermodesulfobacteriota bacterium]|nr:efflux RND transporter periplasmic adaptor subunit [Thermodesulfobacteriota bacterium]
MKKRLRILIPLVAVIGIGVLVYNVFFRNGDAGDTLLVSGNIEVTEARIGFKVPGTLDRRMVDEGDQVTRGQVVAMLDNRDQQVAVTRAEANVAYSQSVLDELTAGTRPQDIERARAELERAEAAYKVAQVRLSQARSDFKRFEALYKDSGISRREFEQYKTGYETAQSQSREAAARVANAREALSLSKEGPRKETLDQATAQLKSAKAALTQARLQLAYTELKAPMDGVVLTKAAETGEFLTPGSAVFVIGDLAHPWVRAYINETDMGRVRLKNKADITIDSYPDKIFDGAVSYISDQAEFTPKSVQTFEERVKLMFRIKINVPNPDGLLKPGMPADARIACPAPRHVKS